jgi:hypothetical protein
MVTHFILKNIEPYLIEEFKDEAIGDSWEYYDYLLKQKKPRIYRGAVMLWRALCLLLANYRIKRMTKANKNSH